jgi:hypothetical protein
VETRAGNDRRTKTVSAAKKNLKHTTGTWFASRSR